jgi:hypothetical protein
MNFWKRHANPISGWSRIFTAPIIFLIIWFHLWFLLIPLVIWVIVNPIIFPEAKNFDSWASKSVLGERYWTKHIKIDLNLGLNILSGTFFVPSLFYTYFNDFWPAIFYTTLSFLFKIWFCDRMAYLYEKQESKKMIRKL